jgi:hypothetical protein
MRGGQADFAATEESRKAITGQFLLYPNREAVRIRAMPTEFRRGVPVARMSVRRCRHAAKHLQPLAAAPAIHSHPAVSLSVLVFSSSLPELAMDTELGRKICVIAVALALLPACDDSKSKGVVYTLYRNSPAFADMRIHVATFDAAEDKDYNRDNCEIARDLFASQPGVTFKYWCERGRFSE